MLNSKKSMDSAGKSGIHSPGVTTRTNLHRLRPTSKVVSSSMLTLPAAFDGPVMMNKMGGVLQPLWGTLKLWMVYCYQWFQWDFGVHLVGETIKMSIDDGLLCLHWFNNDEGTKG